MKKKCNNSYFTKCNNAALNDIESLILATLSIRRISAGEIINVPELHNDFLKSGFTAREFSKAFVGLLMHRFMQPCGEFTYLLTMEGFQAGENALRLCRFHAGSYRFLSE